MAKKDIKFTLDTIYSRYSPVGTVKQLDSVFFYIKITENGVTKDLTGQTIKLFAIKEDKKIVEQTTKINITNQSEGLVEIELLNAAIQVHGFTYFELEISDSNGIISTADFILRVNKRVGSPEAIESTNEVSTLKEIEVYVAQAKQEIKEFKALQNEMLKVNNTINTQEALRKEAEDERIQAEKSRIEAEKKREETLNEFYEDFAKLKDNVENLFNKDDVEIEKGKFINVNGGISSATGYNISGFIAANPNDVFTHKFNSKLSGKDATFIYYNNLKTKLGHAAGQLLDDESSCKICMPDNAEIKYFRVTFTDEQRESFMIIRGEKYTENYIEFGKIKLSNDILFNSFQEDSVKKLAVLAIKETPIKPDQTNFFEVSKNLFNKDDVEIEKGKFINVNGGISSAVGYNISGFIEVEEHQGYIYKFNSSQLGNNSTYLYYRENGDLLGYAKGVISENGLTCSLIAPVGAKKIKINFMEIDKNSLMFVRGSSYPSGYEEYGTIKLTESIGLNDKQKEEIKNISPTNPLYGKIITANGDSICYGAGFTGGFVKIIAEKNGMTYQNIAVNGATVTAGTVDSNTSENRHWICRTISNMREDADYCLLEGSVNDIGDNVTFGSITDTMAASLDDTTFCGAFESMLKQATLRFKGKKIGFILVHRMFNLDHDYHTKYYPAILKMCEKWGVPLCNLYTTVPSLNLINDLKQLYTKNADGWHPNEEGYRKYYCDKIEQFLISL
ncbi:BppU family phage baseplate upper protein [Clostridium perfringens]|nr:BppU family phage baseplate upper protein [Clostridium perfringens]